MIRSSHPIHLSYSISLPKPIALWVLHSYFKGAWVALYFLVCESVSEASVSTKYQLLLSYIDPQEVLGDTPKLKLRPNGPVSWILDLVDMADGSWGGLRVLLRGAEGIWRGLREAEGDWGVWGRLKGTKRAEGGWAEGDWSGLVR